MALEEQVRQISSQAEHVRLIVFSYIPAIHVQVLGFSLFEAHKIQFVREVTQVWHL